MYRRPRHHHHHQPHHHHYQHNHYPVRRYGGPGRLKKACIKRLCVVISQMISHEVTPEEKQVNLLKNNKTVSKFEFLFLNQGFAFRACDASEAKRED